MFWRADIATISYAALGVNLKGSTMTLADKLIEAEVFTAEAYHEYFNPQKLLQPTKNSDNFRAGSELKELNANEIHTKCSSAVFYIEIYNANNQAVSSGSGFFITQSGIAVTNYHVIEDASYAKIYTTYDTVHDVLGVYDYDEAGDWAVLQIDGSDFSHLKINSSSVSVGDSIFALGSPRGLDDTISTGIISNPSRILDGQEYIQISAPISHGSSGGALLNSYGEVIGITSAGYDDAQNLNFARPISCIENANLDKYTTLKDNITKASQSVEYSIDNDIVTVEKGQEISLFLNYTVHNRTTESITFTVETTDPSIADVRWGKTDSQPWEIIISGESAGDTLLIISNDATTDFKMVSIRVTPPTTNYGYITYSPYKSNVEVYAGQESSLFIDLFEKNIPSSFDLYYYVSVNDSDIANVRWDKNVQNLPWNVIITGLSPGVTYIEFSNNYNNQIYTVPLTVLPSIDPDIHSLKSALIADGEYNESSDTYEIAVDYIDDSIYSSLRLVYFYEHDKLYLGSLILLDDDVLITYIPVDTTLEVEANILLDDAHAYCKIQPKYYTEKTKLKLSSSKGDKNAISFISNTLTDIIMFTLSGCEDMILSEYGISLYDLGYESLN